MVLGADIKKQADYISTTRSELNLRLKEVNELARLREEANLAAPKTVILGELFLKRDELFVFPNVLRPIASDNGLGFSFNFRSEEPGEGDEPGRATFVSVVQGQFVGVRQFIEALEGLDYLANLTSFDIIAEGSGRYAATLNGEIFFRD